MTSRKSRRIQELSKRLKIWNKAYDDCFTKEQRNLLVPLDRITDDQYREIHRVAMSAANEALAVLKDEVQS